MKPIRFRKALKAILRLFIYPSQLKIILRDTLQLQTKQSSTDLHLKSAMLWLCRSQDQSGSKGCSQSFSFAGGWTAPYPETTGYIISTFLRYASYCEDDSYLERAVQMGDWEIDIQLPSGAIRGGFGINDYPIVFNAGMVILGWTDLYRITGAERFLAASVKAADWLCSIMDDDGKWSRFTFQGIPHAYHSRVSWSLLEVYKQTHDPKYKDAAIRNLRWVLSLKKENGWIDQMGFSKDEAPITHTIAYTFRGLLECSFLLDGELKEMLQNAVHVAAEQLLLQYEMRERHPNPKPKYFPGRFNSEWQPVASFSCLTGNAQTAIIWLKVFQINQDARYLNAAKKLVDQLKEVQDINTRNLGIRGGIAGSHPIWGDYSRYCYPNWAAKFFADAIMLQQKIMQDIH